MRLPSTSVLSVTSCLLTAVLAGGASHNLIAADVAPDNTEESAYRAAITERADKIVSGVGIEDAEQAKRVAHLVADQYRELRDVHAKRDARIADAQPSGAVIATALQSSAYDEAELHVGRLHRTFVARLSADLTGEQVDAIKDGMTYGVVPITYAAYRELLPDLTDEQKREILSNLIEAREYAMDAGSSDEKHSIFGRYKGRINNFLSAAGYDLKRAERRLAQDREK